MGRDWREEDILRELYHGQRLSLTEVGDELGCTAQTVKNNMDRLGIETRSQSQAQQTRGMSIRLTENGHEYIHHQYDGEQANVYIHRLAAVAWYGLDEVTDNDVHHCNGVPWDTREDNTDVMSRSDHSSVHVQDAPWRHEDVLRETYEQNNRQKEATAEALGCSHETVRRYVREFGIEAT